MLLHLQGCDYVLHYCPGMEMSLPHTLSHFNPKTGPEIALDIAIHHACLSPVWKEALQVAFDMNVELLISSSLTAPVTSRKSHIHYIPTGNTVNHSLLKMDLCSMEKPSSSLHQKERRSLVLYTNHTKALAKHSCLPMVVSSGMVSTRPLKMLFGNVKHA